MSALLGFTALFGGALWYYQVYAYYRTVEGLTEITVAGRVVPVADYTGIDADTSGLKLRGCMVLDPADLAEAPLATQPTPLSAPYWFRCFDAVTLTEDLRAGRATAWMAAPEEWDGIDRIIAAYPDGRAYMWRQLNEKYQD